MNSSELHEAFRSGLGVERSRRLSDDDVWRFADEAYRGFVRLIGGIPDFTSAATAVALVASVPTSALDPTILTISRMTRRSDNVNVKIINQTDLNTIPASSLNSDYGNSGIVQLDITEGAVDYAILGMERNKVRWVRVPDAADTVDMMIYRLPSARITTDGQALDEIEDTHHFALLDWMYYLAANTPEVADRPMASYHRAAFLTYCVQAKSENARYQHKPRVVQYGGL